MKRAAPILAWKDVTLWVPAPSASAPAAAPPRTLLRPQEQQEVQKAALEDVSLPLLLAGGPSPADETPGRSEEEERQPSKRILSLVTGIAGCLDGWESGGGVTALMGPSGAGKTSLLDLLAGRHPSSQHSHGPARVEGQISVNGHALTAAEMQSISGYVTQHDVLPGMMTVREHLLFHARLRMGDATPLHAKQRRVKEVMVQLGLDHIQDSIIGDEFVRGVSGGEKRRVSIASELLTLPAVLFLDEPTTGLDSANAMNVVQIISEVARSGTFGGSW